MASAMVRPMSLDGQYAAAQLWKLDSIKGRYFPLATMLADYLMMPAFPSARFKAWAEQYDRAPATVMLTHAMIYLLPHEEIPQHLSDGAKVTCKALRIVDGVQTWIYYNGTVAQYLSQREAIFGTAVPTSMKICEPLTREERSYIYDWDDRYVCPWPFVDGEWRPGYHARAPPTMPRTAHPQLRGLYERYRTFFRQWEAAVEHEPFDGDFSYVVRNYYGGELHSQIAHMREPNPLQALLDPPTDESDGDSTDEWDWD